MAREPLRAEISTARWAIASFVGAVGALALLSVPLAAVAAGIGADAFRQTLLAAFVVAAVAGIVVVVALDLLGARARANGSANKHRVPAV